MAGIPDIAVADEISPEEASKQDSINGLIREEYECAIAKIEKKTKDVMALYLKDRITFEDYERMLEVLASEKAEDIERLENIPVKSVNHTAIVALEESNKSTITDVKINLGSSSGTASFVEDLEKGPGDKTVPLWSATINESIDYILLQGNHTGILKDSKCIDEVCAALDGSEIKTIYLPSFSESIVIKVACPVDVSITYGKETLSSNNFDNRITSFGEIDLIGVDNDIKIVTLHEYKDDYTINLQGTDTGTMDYEIRWYSKST